MSYAFYIIGFILMIIAAIVMFPLFFMALGFSLIFAAVLMRS